MVWLKYCLSNVNPKKDKLNLHLHLLVVEVPDSPVYSEAESPYYFHPRNIHNNKLLQEVSDIIPS